MGKRRSRMDIISDILSAAKNGIRKTQLMYQANLSFNRREKYVDHLTSSGLLKSETNSPVEYKTTNQGKEWMENYEELKSELE